MYYGWLMDLFFIKSCLLSGILDVAATLPPEYWWLTDLTNKPRKKMHSTASTMQKVSSLFRIQSESYKGTYINDLRRFMTSHPPLILFCPISAHSSYPYYMTCFFDCCIYLNFSRRILILSAKFRLEKLKMQNEAHWLYFWFSRICFLLLLCIGI